LFKVDGFARIVWAGEDEGAGSVRRRRGSGGSAGNFLTAY